MKTNSKSNKKVLSPPWHQPITWAGLLCTLLGVWVSIVVMNFASDHVSDAYHIGQIDSLIHKALDIKQDSSISDENKRKRVDALIEEALHHNNKIVIRIKSNKRSIQNLEAGHLRSSRFD